MSSCPPRRLYCHQCYWLACCVVKLEENEILARSQSFCGDVSRWEVDLGPLNCSELLWALGLMCQSLFLWCASKLPTQQQKYRTHLFSKFQTQGQANLVSWIVCRISELQIWTRRLSSTVSLGKPWIFSVRPSAHLTAMLTWSQIVKVASTNFVDLNFTLKF